MNRTSRFRKICIGGLVLCGALALLPAAGAAQTSRVLVLPFAINAQEDLTFLQEGVRDMLGNRLSDPGKVSVLDKAQTDELLEGFAGTVDTAAALELAQTAGADYAAFGSLTIFGESISTDATFVDVAAGSPVVRFNEYGQDQGDVIFHVNVFAGQVNEKVFGRKTFAYQPRQPQASAEAPASGSRAHPEAVWRREREMRISPEVSGEPAATLWKTRRFTQTLRSVAIGDVDGDGNNETVFVSSHRIFIYRHVQGRFTKVQEIEGVPYITYISVDAADVNGNGAAEIFVSGIDDDFRAESCVLEFDGRSFAKIVENSDWYYRVLTPPGRGGKVLFGQKGGWEDIFYGGVYELSWSGNGYAPATKVVVPDNLNVFAVNFGDVLNTGKDAIIALESDEELHIYVNGKEEWASGEPYGGSYAFLISPEEKKELERANYSRRDEDPMPMSYFWLPQRVHVADLDRDGRSEVLVVRNMDAAQRILTRTRSFKKGRFECLSWDNVGLSPKWKTRSFSGYISDNILGDIDNDGADELVFITVRDASKGLLTEKKSYLVSWDPKE